jgi:hypothetical protein
MGKDIPLAGNRIVFPLGHDFLVMIVDLYIERSQISGIYSPGIPDYYVAAILHC